MALEDNDYLETSISMRTTVGGNGDYYLELWGIHENGSRTKNVIRICTSGGSAPSDVVIAVARLHQALENNGLNNHPYDDERARKEGNNGQEN